MAITNFKSLKKNRKKLDIAMSNFISLKKNRKKLDIAMSNFISLKKTEINWTLQCLILNH